MVWVWRQVPVMVMSESELRRQRAAQAAELNDVGEVGEEDAQMRDSSAGLQVALAEYSQGSLLWQASLTRVDQSLTLLVAGLAILATAEAGVFVALWASDRTAFYVVTAVLGTVGFLIVWMILDRDVRTRLMKTRAGRAQARLRNYFVSVAPDIELYLTDTLHDDWLTPYTYNAKPTTPLEGMPLTILAAVHAGSSAAAVVLAVHGGTTWVVTVGIAVTVGAYATLTFLVRRAIRLERQSYTPMFPRTARTPPH